MTASKRTSVGFTVELMVEVAAQAEVEYTTPPKLLEKAFRFYMEHKNA